VWMRSVLYGIEENVPIGYKENAGRRGGFTHPTAAQRRDAPESV